MCGIAGWINTKKTDLVPQRQTDRMLRLMAHRGPDGQGVYHGTGVSVGMNRLAIVGQAPSLPFANANKRIVVALNGEIYNWRELAEEVLGGQFAQRDWSDGRVLPYLFEALGESLFERLVGMFALAIWDSRTDTMILARDRLGIKPLFWWKQDQRVTFSSELHAFRAWDQFPPPLATEWLASYLHFRFVPHPHTLLKGVFKVSPGTAVTFSRGASEPSILSYWSLGQSTPHKSRPASYHEAREELDVLLRQVMWDHRAPLGVASSFLLSGGVDSSLMTTLAVREGAAAGPAITLDDPSNVLERTNAEKTATLLGIPVIPTRVGTPSIHHLLEVFRAIDEPLGDPTAVSLGLVLRDAARHGRIIYSGEGADELFLGYAVYRRARWHRWAQHLGGPHILRRLGEPLHETYYGVGGTFTPNEARTLVDRQIWETRAPLALSIPPHTTPVRTMQAIDLAYTLPDDVLTKADRLAMAWGMELRVPFLDHRLVEWVWSLPDRWLGLRGDKPLLRSVAERSIPRSIAYREKAGFPTPISAWLSGPWVEWVDDMLHGPIAQRPIWNYDGITRLREALDPSGQRRQGRQLFAVLALEAWLESLAKHPSSYEEESYVPNYQL